MKTLLVFAPEHQREQPEKQRQREAADESPRVSLLEEILTADVIDGSALQTLRSRSRLVRWLGKVLPLVILQALVVYHRRRRYDVVVSWDDRFALVYALLLRLTRSRSRHVAILSWMAPPKKALALKRVQKGIDRIVLWSQTQHDLLVEFSGISAAKITVIPYFVDQQFWRPLPVAVEGICSAGDSRRDYATLIEALAGLDLPCRIATHVQIAGSTNSDWNETSRSLGQTPTLPTSIQVKAASLPELRSIYAHAHFVVLPLFPSFRDSGITIITQAMAMGKAIICSRIQGQLEFLEEGVTGLFVPPGDPQALREAIQYLLDHPEVAERMGQEGRRRAETIFALDYFAVNIRQIAEDVVAGIPTMRVPHSYQARKSCAPPAEKSGAI